MYLNGYVMGFGQPYDMVEHVILQAPVRPNESSSKPPVFRGPFHQLLKINLRVVLRFLFELQLAVVSKSDFDGAHSLSKVLFEAALGCALQCGHSRDRDVSERLELPDVRGSCRYDEAVESPCQHHKPKVFRRAPNGDATAAGIIFDTESDSGAVS